MGLSMLRGESWKTLMKTVLFKPFDYSRFLYCGLRGQSDIQRQRVIDSGMQSIWGSTENKVNFAAELKMQLERKNYSPTLVHLDLDVLDDSYGKVNDYPSPGGMFESDLISCMELVPQLAVAKSLTVCLFDPNAGDGDKIAAITSRAITTFVGSLLKSGGLAKS
jgi:arginase